MTIPCNPYGYAKDALRRQLEFLGAAHPSCNLTWIRFFYRYGDGQPVTSLHSQLSRAVSKGEDVFDMSGGEQQRDYLRIEEATRLIVEPARKCSAPGVVNACSGKPVSIRKLVEGWLYEKGWNIRLNLGRYPCHDHEPMAFRGDRKRLDAVLGTI